MVSGAEREKLYRCRMYNLSLEIVKDTASFSKGFEFGPIVIMPKHWEVLFMWGDEVVEYTEILPAVPVSLLWLGSHLEDSLQLKRLLDHLTAKAISLLLEMRREYTVSKKKRSRTGLCCCITVKYSWVCCRQLQPSLKCAYSCFCSVFYSTFLFCFEFPSHNCLASSW